MSFFSLHFVQLRAVKRSTNTHNCTPCSGSDFSGIHTANRFTAHAGGDLSRTAGVHPQRLNSEPLYCDSLNALSFAVKERRFLGRVSDIARKKEPRGRTRFLSDEERVTLLDACAKSAWPALRTLVLLAITTGARRGS